VNRLAAERGALFARASANFGWSKSEKERLVEVERELDECFVLRRSQRATRDARRFSRDESRCGLRRDPPT
jgi:hypothetical protein